MKINEETYNLNVLEGTSNKIDKTSYNLDALELLQNTFRTSYFVVVKQIKIFLICYWKKNCFLSQLLIPFQKQLLGIKKVMCGLYIQIDHWMVTLVM